jgi:hypothetical protein
MHQTFGMHPTQRVPADRELPSVVTHDDGVAR